MGGIDRNRIIQKSPILVGRTALESRRGSSSSQHPPYVAITTSNTDWFHGETFCMAMLYSGSHIESIEKDVYGQIRVTQGIHPDTLHWNLGPIYIAFNKSNKADQ